MGAWQRGLRGIPKRRFRSRLLAKLIEKQVRIEKESINGKRGLEPVDQMIQRMRLGSL
jgi:hypothetical protein